MRANEYHKYPSNEIWPELGNRAVSLNRVYARQLGWQSYFDRIVSLLGFTTYTPAEIPFARAIARWQQQQGLAPDGVIGKRTWARMAQALGLEAAKELPAAKVDAFPRVLRTIFSLPKQLADAVKAGMLSLEVALAIISGELDVNKLANMVFFARHPERDPKRGGKPIQPHEKQLAREWLDIRNRLIKPALQIFAKGVTPHLPAPAGIPPVGGPRVPKGFREYKRKGVSRGLDRKGGDRVDKKLVELVRQGRVSVPNEDIDTFQRVANVETGGLVQGINTWDSAVVSIGFMQWTLQHGKVQEWIKRAEQAFKRFGIELDSTRKFAWTRGGKVIYEQAAIKGASTRDELRWNGWAERFFLAGLDDDVIAVEVNLAQEHLQRHLNGLRRHLGDTALFQKFMLHYQASLQIRGIFQAAYNNLPAAALNGTTRAIRRAGAVATERFIDLLQEDILQAYVERNDNGSRIVSETRTGARFT